MFLSDLIRQSKRAVVFTGAGMSTESGLQDFRGIRGMWKGRNPYDIASVEAMENNYEEFIKFYQWRIQERDMHKPNIGHYILAEWEGKGIINCIITQNVDGYHQQAGSSNVIELHGNLDMRIDERGILRPNVVLFDEELPIEAVTKAEAETTACDLFMVLGSSLMVSPANTFPVMAKANGATLIIVNHTPTELDKYADVVIRGNISRVLQKINDGLLYSPY
jgi:NAD-dependent deacetylase